MWAADGALGAGHVHGFFGSGAAAILFGAIQASAFAAGDFDFLGHGLVAGHLLLDGLDHAAFAAFRTAGCDDLLVDDVITAGFDLARFGVVVSAM